MAIDIEQGEEQQRARSFNPNEHLMQLKSRDGSKDYLPVQWRLVWFREKFPHGTIETELVHLDLDREVSEEVTVWEERRPKKVMKQAKGFAVFRATVKDGKGGIATGTGSEAAVSFGDYIEKAETKAVGRALAAMGFGTQFTGDELDEGKRIADSPVGHTTTQQSRPAGQSNGLAVQSTNDPHEVRKERLNAIYNMFFQLGLFEKGATTNETQANFYTAVSSILKATVTTGGQLTNSRVEQLEEYIAKQQSSDMIQAS